MNNWIKKGAICSCISLSLTSIIISSIFINSYLESKNSGNNIFNDNVHSVIEIKCLKNELVHLGTAICVDTDVFITNAHVVLYEDNGCSFNFENYFYRFCDDKNWESFDVISFNSKIDIAIIKIHSSKSKKVKIYDDPIFNVGDKIFGLGNAFGQGLTLNSGMISSKEVIINDSSYICSDNRVVEGYSGGGLFLENGKFLGMITSVTQAGELTYSLCLKEIINYLKGVNYENKTI